MRTVINTRGSVVAMRVGAVLVALVLLRAAAAAAAARPAGAVVVVGSLNVDLTLPVHRLPARGETTISRSAASTTLGGKGANQAVAAARAGGAAWSARQ